MKKAFTLPEITVVLVVVGILAAILLPMSKNIIPNANLMKFHKAHTALYSAIYELTTSDKYYLGGDLGIKADGTILGKWKTNPEQRRYFCETLANVLITKSVACSESTVNAQVYLSECHKNNTGGDLLSCNGQSSSQEFISNIKNSLDNDCKVYPILTDVTADQIVLPNGTVFYDVMPSALFGSHFTITTNGVEENIRIFSPPSKNPPNFYNEAGVDIMYKPFCIDIDGVPENATQDDCVNECPFGYGIRADGKILNGARAEEWLKKATE